MAKKTFFVTGTDTDAGKTTVCAGLLEKANQQSLRCFGLKPVAAGCEETPEGLRNADALRHLQAANVALDYAEVNPITLAPPIAPHIAAEQEGRRLSAERIAGLVRGSLFNPADFVLVEGAGGWRVPLNNRETFADVAKQLKVPVILVVGMKLGCINHALLTAEAIVRDGCVLAGWVANQIDPNMSCFEENLATLKNAFRAPLLGVIPHLESDDAVSVAKFLSIDALLE